MSKHTNQIIRTALDLVKPRFRLALDHGEHGIKHWVRVWANAELLCAHYNVDPTVPCWFAFLHDSQRDNEGSDPWHGPRAARFAWELWNAKKLPLSPGQMNQLDTALLQHSEGYNDAPCQIVAICWDADRLDLGRVGIVPDPKRLCTQHARHPAVIEAAYCRSTRQTREQLWTPRAGAWPKFK